jgi:small redox-active disulfide protein 2
MNIKILGGGCANCRKLEAVTRKVVEKNGIEAEFEHVTEYSEIMKWPVLSTPGLVVDDQLVCAGRIPSETEILSWIKKP